MVYFVDSFEGVVVDRSPRQSLPGGVTNEMKCRFRRDYMDIVSLFSHEAQQQSCFIGGDAAGHTKDDPHFVPYRAKLSVIRLWDPRRLLLPARTDHHRLMGAQTSGTLRRVPPQLRLEPLLPVSFRASRHQLHAVQSTLLFH